MGYRQISITVPGQGVRLREGEAPSSKSFLHKWKDFSCLDDEPDIMID
jgi:hypothetical protein